MRIREVKVLTVREAMSDYEPQISHAHDVETLWRKEVQTRDWYDSEKECMMVFHLDTKHRVNCYHLVSLGNLNSSVVHPREVFRSAVVNAAHSVLIAHNHPSDDATPSPEDLAITRKLQQAGQILDIQLLDHVIITARGFLSLRERGLL